MSELEFHSRALREYDEYVIAGLGGDWLAVVKRRVEETKNAYHLARQRYTNHIHNHRC